MKFIDQFIKARKAGVPLIAIQTMDPAATMDGISKRANGCPMMRWDVVGGVKPINEAGAAAVDRVWGEIAEGATNPIDVLSKSVELPENSMLFMLNVNRYFTNPQNGTAVIQAFWNIRDSFKGDGRSAVILCPALTLPAELQQDVFIMDEPLPTSAELEDIVRETYVGVTFAAPIEGDPPIPVKPPTPAFVDQAVDAIKGLSPFAAETVCAMSMTKDGLDLEMLWEKKRRTIEQTSGLTVYRGKETFDDVKGVSNLATYSGKMMRGRINPSIVMFVDEIEKMFAGVGNDQDSVTKEMLGAFLTWCEQKNERGDLMVMGIMLIGHPGTGKSLIAKATGNQFKRPTIIADFSAMKTSLLGDTQKALNQSLRVIDAVAGDKPKFLIVTCNKIGALPPELRRRFCYGTFFVDLPDKEGREDMWKMYTKFYDIPDKDRPVDTDWTGAEIRNCCMIASQMGSTLKEAAGFIVPVAQATPDKIEALRREAVGKFIDASRPGKYNMKTVENEPGTPKRRIGVQ